MKKKRRGGARKVTALVTVGLFLLALQACGSGSGDESSPIGLFGESSDASVSLPENGSVQNAMGLFNSQIGEFGVSTTLLSASKAISMVAAAPSCEQIDSHHVACNTGLPGPTGGGVNYQLSFNCEDSSNGGRCDIPMVLQFGNFAYQNDCQKTLEVSGVFRCQLTEVLEGTEGDRINSRFSGQCNTQDNSNQENQMILNVDGQKIKVGFDLGVQSEKTIRLNEQHAPVLKEMNLRGVVSVNGVSYSFETLKNMGPSLCP